MVASTDASSSWGPQEVRGMLLTEGATQVESVKHKRLRFLAACLRNMIKERGVDSELVSAVSGIEQRAIDQLLAVDHTVLSILREDHLERICEALHAFRPLKEERLPNSMWAFLNS